MNFYAPSRHAIAAVFSLLLIFPGSSSWAYEFSTHAALTREAFVRWTGDAANADMLDRLGLTATKDSLGFVYFSMSTVPTERLASPEDNQIFGQRHVDAANRSSVYKPTLESIAGWLMLGSIREDDVPLDPGAVENTPQDEPVGPFIRVLNHFYDPFLDRGLFFLAATAGSPAPDWALLGIDVNNNHANQFAIGDAREAMWRALSLREYRPNEPGLIYDVPFAPTSNIQSREALRTAYWATTFRALGDVLHLLQDMAQPQHTRNDPHSGRGCYGTVCLGGHASYYENYVDARATGAGSFRLRERLFETYQPTPDIAEQVAINPLSYDGYPTVRFSQFQDFFSTATHGASLGGLGLANYSNQGFYSVGTNILETSYPRPSVSGESLQRLVVLEGTVKNALGEFIPKGTLTLLVGPVLDALHPDFSDGAAVKLSSLGAFDQFLLPGRGQYSLNHYNYDDQARLLIPRAVAYSAGLLDYFFRGKMEISLPDEGVYSILDHSTFAPPAPQTNSLLDFKGFSKIKLRLKNTTADITPPQGPPIKQEMSSGTLVAVMKFRRNLCYVDTLDNEITSVEETQACRNPVEEIVVSDPLINQSVPFGDASHPNGPELTFTFQRELPINAWDVILQIVYRGRLGSEDDAVAVMSKDISEPTFTTIYNDTDFVSLGGTCYRPDAIAASDNLWNQLALTCRDVSSGSRKVSDSCARVPLNVRYTFGSTASPVTVAKERGGAFDDRLLHRRFARIALLGDSGTPLPVTFDFHNAPLHAPGGDTQQESLETYIVQKDAPILDAYSKHRGIKFWNALTIVVDGTSGSTASECAGLNEDLLQGTERYPSAVTITGWNQQM